MFMTTILISNKLFDSLTPEQQKVFRRAAKEVAKLERKWSVDDAEQYEVNAKENGITIKEVSKEEKIKMFDAAVPQYRLANKLFPGSRELVAKIKTS
jgi:TRAP-type C4-dicarboxylate transport system substrate-binding protein